MGQVSSVQGSGGNKSEEKQGAQHAPMTDRAIAAFTQEVRGRLVRGERFYNRTEYEKLAVTHGITSRREAKECVELAIVQVCRVLALSGKSEAERLADLVHFYQFVQPNMSFQTSESKTWQQYSTPTPLGFIAGTFTRIAQAERVFEPSAGNGMLLVGTGTANCYVNELSKTRLRMLGFQFEADRISNLDAEQRFTHFERFFDVVHSNPPFRPLKKQQDFNGYVFRALEHVMCGVALETMKDEGRAALIIGQHTEANESGMILRGRYFFNWLYRHYHVADIINVQGKLYGKQGTTFPIRMILISGRKQRPYGSAPEGEALKPLLKEETDFMQIYERVKLATAWIPQEAPEPEPEPEPENPLDKLERELLDDQDRYYALRNMLRPLKLALAERFSKEAGRSIEPTDRAIADYLQGKYNDIQTRQEAVQTIVGGEPLEYTAFRDLQNILNASWSAHNDITLGASDLQNLRYIEGGTPWAAQPEEQRLETYWAYLEIKASQKKTFPPTILQWAGQRLSTDNTVNFPLISGQASAYALPVAVPEKGSDELDTLIQQLNTELELQ